VKTELKYTILLVLLLSAVHSFAQQPPHYTQYVFNNYMINPAVTGSKKCFEVKMGYRTQWLGFDAAPQTMFLSIHGRLRGGKKRISKSTYEGIGGYVIKDMTGPISKLGAHLSYAFHIPINRHLTAALGLSIGIMQYTINGGLLDPVLAPDPAIVSVQSIIPDANAGVWLYSDDFFAGLAARQILPINIAGTQNKMQTHMFLTAGYRLKLYPNVSVIPAIHSKIGLITPAQIEGTLKVDYKNLIWVGVAYRKIDAVAGLLGFTVANFLSIGYAFDYTLSALKDYSSNSHEIILSINPGCNKKKHAYCPAYN